MQKILEKIPFKGFFYSSLIVNFVMLIFDLAVQKLLPLEIPLFYGLPRGESQLSTPLGILVPSIFALIFSVVNLSFASIIKDEFAKSILVISGFIMTLFAAVTSIKIIFLVGGI